MLTLREYQKEPTRKAVRYFRSDSDVPSLIVLPTAWGKSILTAYTAKYIRPEDRLLVVQPTKELLEQNFHKYELLCEGEEPAGIYSASFRKKELKRITYATIGSIKDMGATFREMGFTKMLIDEAHMYPRKEQSMLGKFLKDSGIRQVLGITATPLKLEQFTEKQGDRYDKWSELVMLTNPSLSGTFFKQILHVGQIQEMTSLEFWSPLLYERIPFDPKELRLNSTGSEFTKDSEELAYRLNNIRENIFAALDFHAERRHCLVFVPSVEEAQILASEYPNSAYVSGDMPKKERDSVITAFREGRIRTIINVSVLSVGFDYPEIDLILLATTTASVARYYQILGRGVRIHPDKRDCLIIDMGGNIDRFGFVENISFEQSDRWRMFGTGGMLLSGLPVSCLGCVYRQELSYCGPPSDSLLMTFGKHRGKTVDQLPMSYRSWFIKNQRTGDVTLRGAMIASIENHIRDTRNDPMAELMPDGQHAGVSIGMVPKGYLRWYYNAQEWNECNDSLRRAIEYHYGGVPPRMASDEKGDKKKTKSKGTPASSQFSPNARLSGTN